jgi:glycosyltransferase involved in cell wall biosynthesis
MLTPVDFVDGLVGLICLPWLVRSLFFQRMVVAAATAPAVGRFPSPVSPPADEALKMVILVPAHNEAASIAATVHSLQQLDYPDGAYEILVIADNCQDETASVARNAGATVLERQDAAARGKGYALEFAVAHLQERTELPDALVIIDADTQAAANLLAVFHNYFRAGYDWLQAYYSVANPEASWRTHLMTYALSLFNGVWLLAQDRLGLGATLRGNGMGYRWPALARCPLKAYSLAEDMEYSWRLRLAGESVRFVGETAVYGEMVSQGQAAVSQRLRWETGRQLLIRQFQTAIWQTDWRLAQRFWAWGDLMMWPLGRFLAWTLVVGAGLGAKQLLLQPTLGSLILAGYWGSVVVGFGVYACLPFIKMSLPWRYAQSFYLAPLYFAWKLTLLAQKAPTRWVRTQRNRDQGGGDG